MDCIVEREGWKGWEGSQMGGQIDWQLRSLGVFHTYYEPQVPYRSRALLGAAHL